MLKSYLLSSRTPVVEAPLAFEQNPVLAASQSHQYHDAIST